MGYGVGIVLSILVTLFARSVKFDRDRAFYPTVLIVVASYYVLFAAMGATPRTLAIECAIMGCFGLSAVVGFRYNLWIVVVGLVGHGVFDVFHGKLVNNPGVPRCWPDFCMAYDVVAGACFAWVLTQMKNARPTIQMEPVGD